jgi:hypothetical protein
MRGSPRAARWHKHRSFGRPMSRVRVHFGEYVDSDLNFVAAYRLPG